MKGDQRNIKYANKQRKLLLGRKYPSEADSFLDIYGTQRILLVPMLTNEDKPTSKLMMR